MKVVVFNVGGALSSYIEIGNIKLMVDVGSGDDFSPVKDFLVPLFERRGYLQYDYNGLKKYRISQLIISHPHKDHLSDIQKFDDHIYPFWLTTPNSNSIPKNNPININWNAIDSKDDENVKYLRTKMLPRRAMPFKVADTTTMSLAYLYPRSVENSDSLKEDNSYTNDVSLSVFFKGDKYSVFFPGDIQKQAMHELLSDESELSQNGRNKLKARLKEGVDFLVCPHHGLKSSFSTDLFSCMKDGKTNKLNIVSEKPTKKNDTRQVDSRYSTSDYCQGNNNLSTNEGPVYQRKTSNGHIFIDDNGKVSISPDIEDIIDLFCE